MFEDQMWPSAALLFNMEMKALKVEHAGRSGNNEALFMGYVVFKASSPL